MRGYFWGNMYLSSIQQGIQSAHCMSEMFIKYQYTSSPHPLILSDWASHHKTMILLNGGYSETLRTLLTMFRKDSNPYPFASFNEGQDALDGALTCVGIILPERIYGASALARKNRVTVRTVGDFIDTKCEVESYATLDEIQETGQLVVAAEDNTSDEEVIWKYNSWEAKLIAELNNYSLAS